MRTWISSLVLIAALGMFGVPAAQAERTVDGVGAIEGFVESTDETTRTLFVGEDRFRVARAVENFDEVEVGERVLVDYRDLHGVRVATRITRDLPRD